MSYSFLIGNIICSVGTILLIRKIIKNRSILHGYDFFGSLLTFTALIFLTHGFFDIGDFLSVFFASITLAFWFLATIFSLRMRLKK